MNLGRLGVLAYRFFFLISLALLAVAGLERFVNFFGYTILRGVGYVAGRMLEFASIMILFVVALLLRDVREELRKKHT